MEVFRNLESETFRKVISFFDVHRYLDKAASVTAAYVSLKKRDVEGNVPIDLRSFIALCHLGQK